LADHCAIRRTAAASHRGKYTELRCLAVAGAIEQRLGPLTPIDPAIS